MEAEREDIRSPRFPLGPLHGAEFELAWGQRDRDSNPPFFRQWRKPHHTRFENGRFPHWSLPHMVAAREDIRSPRFPLGPSHGTEF